MIKRTHFPLLSLLLALVFMGGYGVRVLAEGAPTQQPLSYAGTLEIDGAPAEGPYTLRVTIHDDPSDGETLCEVESAVTASRGRFRIDVSSCADALRGEPDAYLALRVTGPDGPLEIPGRTKIGAVPYALEADHARSATSAAGATGALQDVIAQLTQRIQALEGTSPPSSTFYAVLTQAQTISGQTGTVLFDSAFYDLADEYDRATGIFSPKTAGVYEVACGISWAIAAKGVTTQWEAAIYVNGVERTFDGSYGDGYAVTRLVEAQLNLSAGDRVWCNAYHEGLSDMTVNAGESTHFGARLVRK